MKTNIKYSIVDFIFWAVAVSISLIGLIALATDRRFGGSIGYLVFFLISIIMFLHSIYNIQWFNISDEYITVNSPFGVIKRVELKQIKKAFRTNAVIYSIKMLSVRRPHIVLCIKKSVTKSSIDDAYNRKKKPYIIIPYSSDVEVFIRAEYEKLCGEELAIML